MEPFGKIAFHYSNLFQKVKRLKLHPTTNLVYSLILKTSKFSVLEVNSLCKIFLLGIFLVFFLSRKEYKFLSFPWAVAVPHGLIFVNFSNKKFYPVQQMEYRQ